jgi:hypothetical protein
MEDRELADYRREARLEATTFLLIAAGLLVLLALVSMHAGWTLRGGVRGWIWLLLCIPELGLVGALFYSAQQEDYLRARRLIRAFVVLVVLGNAAGLTLLVVSLLTEKLPATQLLTTGAVVWFTNVIVFGLWFWTIDGGGPVERAKHKREIRDFQFPQDENPQLAEPGWYPRLEDYTYVALTNAIAFSPTDAMPLKRWPKRLMALESMLSVVAILLVAARAVNILGG